MPWSVRLWLSAAGNPRMGTTGRGVVSRSERIARRAAYPAFGRADPGVPGDHLIGHAVHAGVLGIGPEVVFQLGPQKQTDLHRPSAAAELGQQPSDQAVVL